MNVIESTNDKLQIKLETAVEIKFKLTRGG